MPIGVISIAVRTEHTEARVATGNLPEASKAPDPEPIDLDVLRGWHERRDPTLTAAHALPALATLVLSHPDGRTRALFELHGPETYIGRYHPQHGPVDLILTGLRDHEIYKLSAPHVRLTLEERGQWMVRPMSPAAITELDGQPLHDTRRSVPIEDGAKLRLGATEFAFEKTDVDYGSWLEAKKELLVAVEQPALFLCRSGGPCGPRIGLDPDAETVVGRSFPTETELPSKSWSQTEQPDWDLAGVYEHERKFIGFRHAAFKVVDGDQWVVDPITVRQRTYVNRVEISGATPLMPGDEVGMGSVLFHFHDPSNIRASTESRTAELPTVVNWQEEHAGPSSEVEVDEADEDET